MTLAEAEALAREVNAHVYHNDEYGEPTDACRLARMLLAVLPVVRAAQRDAAPSVEVQAALSHLHATTEGNPRCIHDHIAETSGGGGE